MSYSRQARLGQPPPAQQPTSPGGELDTEVSPTLVHELTQPVEKRRGWVAVPTYDMREYVKSQVFTAIAGFVLGVGLGAVFGNFLAGKQLSGAVGKVIRNPKRPKRRSSRKPKRNPRRRRTSPRRTSTRRRKRGRPTARAVTEKLSVKLPDGVWRISVDRGQVVARGRAYGTVYDLGTSFRAIPYGGPVGSYGTLAGAVKHVIRRSETP